MGQGAAKAEPVKHTAAAAAAAAAAGGSADATMAALGPTRAFFAASKRFAVVGASADRSKFGNKVLLKYQGAGLAVTVRAPPHGTPRRAGRC
jgi:hypothetical protein